MILSLRNLLLQLLFGGCFILGTLSQDSLPVIASETLGRPAFTRIFPSQNNKDNAYDLVVTAFFSTPGKKDNIWLFPDFGSQLEERIANESFVFNKELLTDELPWPNDVGLVPDEVFGKTGLMWNGNGFLAPGKEDGSIAIIDLTSPNKTIHTLSSKSRFEQWFYHQVIWYDMNGDSRLDAVTARGNFDKEVYELVWFEHPEKDADTVSWEVNRISEGCDVGLRLTTLKVPDGKEFPAIFCAEYFNERLTVQWTEDPAGVWTNANMIKYLKIDEGIGHYFELEIVDLNGDGRDDILVSVNKPVNGKLMAYEMPEDDFRTGLWHRILIAEGFDSRLPPETEGTGTPGAPLHFKPKWADGQKKPHLALTGDDDGGVYHFVPRDQDNPYNWEYSMEKLHEMPGPIGSTLGSLSVLDLDGDGYEEIVCPGWSTNRVDVLSFSSRFNGSLPLSSNVFD